MNGGDVNPSVRIDRDILLNITDPRNERNVYVHPNALARAIFWKRLEAIYGVVCRRTQRSDRVLDFGGGSGVFARALSQRFEQVDIVDLDADDATHIKDHFNLGNVSIYTEDIRSFTPALPYDVIIAADVLEHFKDLSVPVVALQRMLRPEGLLVTSSPTENGLYRLGRLLVSKTKPDDHFHRAEGIVRFLRSNGFDLQESASVPRMIIPIPLFNIGVFSKDTATPQS